MHKTFYPSLSPTLSLLVYLSGILPVNANAEANKLNLNYINSFIFYSSRTRLSNDILHHNQQLMCSGGGPIHARVPIHAHS